MQLFSAGESYCINLLSQRELLAFIDTISSDNQNQIAFFSRLHICTLAYLVDPHGSSHKIFHLNRR